MAKQQNGKLKIKKKIITGKGQEFLNLNFLKSAK